MTRPSPLISVLGGPERMMIPKAEWERLMFTEFAAASGLPIELDSIASRKPPAPDIEFMLAGQQHFAELVEITDEDLARRHSIAVKTGAMTAGAFSPATPLVDAFQGKSQKRYSTGGAPLILLAYYDKQYPADSIDPGLIPREVGAIAAEMVASGGWKQVWVYDSWKKRVLWCHP